MKPQTLSRTAPQSRPPTPGAGADHGPGLATDQADSAGRATDTVIDVRGLTKTYGDRSVIRGLDLSVSRGEIFGILGPNGAGKTTTVEAIQGLRRVDAGHLRVLGLDPFRDRQRLRSQVGSQLQSSSLPERLRVGEALRTFARLAGDVVDWREALDTWGLTSLRRSAFGGLSGGERQRLFIALALVNDPQVVFLDELTQGLDPAARRETWALIRQIRDRGATVVLVSHYMDEVEQLADRAAVLHDGRITACDTPANLVALADGAVRTRFTLRAGEHPGRLDQLPGVVLVAREGRRTEVVGDRTTPVLVAAELARVGILPEDLTVVRPSLEDVFVQLTSGEVAA
ncbi:ABC transporter ATP-binding protein [Ornithinimicrobium cavernae]|uniref:ABC transporter ATP-binding protein n=1 Tax=Ornithinimicrobium cavernae TaxID=2666047 RepID=UPI000D690A11|nr:ABC transporter ATP-binding protein [Ornithinimicrobium cavernae]